MRASKARPSFLLPALSASSPVAAMPRPLDALQLSSQCARLCSFGAASDLVLAQRNHEVDQRQRAAFRRLRPRSDGWNLFTRLANIQNLSLEQQQRTHRAAPSLRLQGRKHTATGPPHWPLRDALQRCTFVMVTGRLCLLLCGSLRSWLLWRSDQKTANEWLLMLVKMRGAKHEASRHVEAFARRGHLRHEMHNETGCSGKRLQICAVPRLAASPARLPQHLPPQSRGWPAVFLGRRESACVLFEERGAGARPDTLGNQ